VIPVVTPEEMGEIDRAAPEPTEVLVARAGAAVARAALRLLDGAYGRRVVVVAGKGNNGADGRSAAVRLRARGVGVAIVDAADRPARLPGGDLVIDAAYGTGFRGTYDFPDTAGVPVLAVDIPSGLDGLTGRSGGAPARATATVTFAALKPGLLLGDGPAFSGKVEVADIGLDVSRSKAGQLTDGDVARWWPSRPADSHKWRAAVWVVGGSAGMTGAPSLAATAAMRSGSGYVRLSTPGAADSRAPIEVVVREIPSKGWDRTVLDDSARFGSIVVGPGLGNDPANASAARELAARSEVPVVVDGDGLRAIAAGGLAFDPQRPTVLTPHDGEFEALVGSRPGDDRIDAARGLASARGVVALLKGPTTVIAAPDGRVAMVKAGDQRLATAGSGDVLSGMIGAAMAMGLAPFEAAAAAAHLHGRAAERGPAQGLMAGDLPGLVPGALAAIVERAGAAR
jgi:NAD(P)H-hydrate epimerase